MNNLNLQKKHLKKLLINSTLIFLFSIIISIILIIVGIIELKEININGFHNASFGTQCSNLSLIIIPLIIIVYGLSFVFTLFIRYKKLNKIKTSTSENLSIFCKKVIVTIAGLKIKTNKKTYIYILPENIMETPLEKFKEKFKNKIISIQCYTGTRLIKKLPFST